MTNITSIPSVDVKEIQYKLGEKDVAIHIRTSLTFEERVKLTEYIANFPFMDSDYIPYMRDMGRYTYVFIFYTDLDIGSMSPDEIYRLSQDKELLKAIYQATDDDIGEIFADADRMIEWRKEKLLHRAADELCDGLSAFVSHIEAMLSKAEKAFDPTQGGISMQQLVDALNGVKAKDEKALAHNVLDFQTAQRNAARKPVKRKTPAAKNPE